MCLPFKFGIVQHAKWTRLKDRLSDLELDLGARRISQLRFSHVEKEDDISHDMWFDMVTYISDNHDGVQSYYEKHAWLKCFVLPFNSASSKEFGKNLPEKFGRISGDLREARIEFELRPLEFIEHIEEFSGLLRTRDLCKQLVGYLGKEETEEKRDSNLQFWIWLQAEILAIDSPKAASTDTGTEAYTNEQEIPKRIQSSVQKYRESHPESSYNTAANQFGAFLERSNKKEELQRTEMGTTRPNHTLENPKY